MEGHIYSQAFFRVLKKKKKQKTKNWVDLGSDWEYSVALFCSFITLPRLTLDDSPNNFKVTNLRFDVLL